jgi:uncharacterized protein (DUF433 family)
MPTILPRAAANRQDGADPEQMGGVPCLRGLRVPVATIVNLVAEGQTAKDIVSLYPDLEAEDVREALLYAAEAVRERRLDQHRICEHG